MALLYAGRITLDSITGQMVGLSITKRVLSLLWAESNLVCSTHPAQLLAIYTTVLS